MKTRVDVLAGMTSAVSGASPEDVCDALVTIAALTALKCAPDMEEAEIFAQQIYSETREKIKAYWGKWQAPAIQ